MNKMKYLLTIVTLIALLITRLLTISVVYAENNDNYNCYSEVDIQYTDYELLEDDINSLSEGDESFVSGVDNANDINDELLEYSIDHDEVNERSTLVSVLISWFNSITTSSDIEPIEIESTESTAEVTELPTESMTIEGVDTAPTESTSCPPLIGCPTEPTIELPTELVTDPTESLTELTAEPTEVPTESTREPTEPLTELVTEPIESPTEPTTVELLETLTEEETNQAMVSTDPPSNPPQRPITRVLPQTGTIAFNTLLLGSGLIVTASAIVIYKTLNAKKMIKFGYDE